MRKKTAKRRKSREDLKSKVILGKEFHRKKTNPAKKRNKKRKRKDNTIKIRKFSLRRILSKFPNLWKKAFFVLVIVSVSAGFVYALLNLEFFEISKVNFVSKSDLQYISESDLEKQRKNIIGQNYFKLNLDDNIVELKNNHNIIKTAYAEKRFPNEINIFIEERNPRFVFINGNACSVVDEKSYVVEVNNCNEDIDETDNTQSQQDSESDVNNESDDPVSQNGEDLDGEELVEPTEQPVENIETQEGTDLGETDLEDPNEACTCPYLEKYPRAMPVNIVKSYIDFSEIGEANSYITRGLLNLEYVLTDNYFAVRNFVILDETLQIEAYRNIENSSGKNTIFLVNLDDDLDTQSAKLKVILEYMGNLDEYSIVDLRFERPVLQE